jgi:ATP-dependent RNA helicase DOB1
VDDVVEIKGRVACEISTGDELLLTEMIFAGIFNDIDSHQAVAILSCFVAGPTKDTTQKKKIKMEEDLAEPLRQMHVSCTDSGIISVPDFHLVPAPISSNT